MATSKKINTTDVKDMNVFKLFEKVVDATSNNGLSVSRAEQKYVKELSNRLTLSNDEIILLSAFLNMSDDRSISNRDLARHFGVSVINILAHKDIINSLREKQLIIKRETSEMFESYFMPHKVIEAIYQGHLPEKEDRSNLSITQFFYWVDKLLEQRKEDILDSDGLYEELGELVEQNNQLIICQELKRYHFCPMDMNLLLLFCNIFVNDNDDNIMIPDIDDFFSHSELRMHVSMLDSCRHSLIRKRLVEHVNREGQADIRAWKLTDFCKRTVLKELNIKIAKAKTSGLTSHKDIAKKELFYNENVTKQINELQSILDQSKMKRIQKRMKEEGLRTGFACLFHGAPGTGKTETVQQLAKLTGRDIMLVDVPSIRSKWVGETEKNIQQIFNNYRAAVKSSRKAPILLFNEADALLNKRQESATRSIDKMENAMQNIILQEMEKLDGIMIATTNLAQSMDAAFERRFLYKIEFEKPGPDESKHIWQALLPGLQEKDARHLAEKYDFSGGQIENIARKQIINNILAERTTTDLAAVEEACDNEIMGNGKKVGKIGFKIRA